MHDLKLIRTQPDVFDAGLEKRGLKAASAQILQLDSDHRSLLTELQTLQSTRNQIAKQFGEAKKKGEDTSALSTQAESLKKKIAGLEEKAAELHEKLDLDLSSLPNLPAPEVVIGSDEKDNVLVRQNGTPRTFSFTPKAHFEIGETLGMMDFERAAKVSGSRFVILYDQLARLERALAAFMIDVHTRDFGYQEVYPPVLVQEKTAYGVGQLPKFREDQFQTTTGLWLIPTAEVVLTSLVAEEILAESELPLRFTAYTPCFRSEAGSAGRDTRGMIRQHQFGKVELVSITTADQSKAEHERMTSAAEEILKRLELPYRVMLLCTGDMGFQSQRTYDLEVWLPSEKAYREISSCSNCGEFQGRRMNARYRPQASATDPKPQLHFVHTLNGSGLAVGRTMVALLENYQQADGSVCIPPVLVPYMGGIEIIKKQS